MRSSSAAARAARSRFVRGLVGAGLTGISNPGMTVWESQWVDNRPSIQWSMVPPEALVVFCTAHRWRFRSSMEI